MVHTSGLFPMQDPLAQSSFTKNNPYLLDHRRLQRRARTALGPLHGAEGGEDLGDHFLLTTVSNNNSNDVKRKYKHGIAKTTRYQDVKTVTRR